MMPINLPIPTAFMLGFVLALIVTIDALLEGV